MTCTRRTYASCAAAAQCVDCRPAVERIDDDADQSAWLRLLAAASRRGVISQLYRFLRHDDDPLLASTRMMRASGRPEVSVMKSARIINTLMFVFAAGLQQYADGYRHVVCVGPGYSGQITFRCSPTNYMVIQSAYYARLPVSTPGFCDDPVSDNGQRGDCVPHADTDRDSVANACNTYDSCVLDYPARSYTDTISACIRATGPVYLYVGYDCLPRKGYDGSVSELIYIGVQYRTTTAPYKTNIISQSYPHETASTNNKCQIRFPSYSVVQVTLRDLRGSSSNASGCAYQLYVYRPGSANNVYREWCATRQSASAWQQTFYLWYTDTHGRSQVVDVVFSRNAASATGAVWIEFEARTAHGQAVQNIDVFCGPSIRLQPLPFSSTPSTSTTTTVFTTTKPTTTTTTTTTITTPSTTTTSTTTTTTPSTSTTTTTPTTTTTTTTTPRPTTTSATTTTTRPTTTTTTTITSRLTTPTTTTTTTTLTSTTIPTTTTINPTTTLIPTGVVTTRPTYPVTVIPSTRFNTTPSASTPASTTTTTTTTTATTSTTTTVSSTGAVVVSSPGKQQSEETLPNDLPVMIGSGVAAVVLLLFISIVVCLVIARYRRQSKIRKLSAMLPDVIGTWKFEGNRGDPGGSGPGGVDLDTSVPEFTSVEELSVHELQPVSSPVSPVLREPIYLQANETPLQQTAAAVTTISTSAPSRTTILFDPATMERRNAGGKVRFVAPEDETIQYPGRGTTFYDEDRNWRTRALMNARDRHPKSLDSRVRRSPPPPRRKTARAAPPSLTSPRVTALQASDSDTQQNPLYGASVDLFIY